LTGGKVSEHLQATGVSIAIDTETKLCKIKYHSHMRELVYGRHLGTRAFHNCKLRLLESVLPIFHHPDEPTCEGLRRLIDELIEHISGDSKAYVWLWHNSARMCETSTGCRGAGVHTPRRACGAAHGDAFTA